jgi:hypothetical protein
MSINISFWRQGHANNSSSTHSVIWTSKHGTIHDDSSEDFGWNQFVCSSRGSKIKYVTICLYQSWVTATGIREWGSIIPQATIRAFLSDNFANWVDANFPILKQNSDHYLHSHKEEFGHVDHQSVIAFPFHRKVDCHINIGFANDFINELVNGNYVILGGNDNEDASHPLDDLNESEFNRLTPVLRVLKDSVPSEIMVEKDYVIGDWVLSSSRKGVGDIMRVSFSSNPSSNAKKTNKHGKKTDGVVEAIVDHMEGQ